MRFFAKKGLLIFKKRYRVTNYNSEYAEVKELIALTSIDYKQDNSFFDEMFMESGAPKDHYVSFYKTLEAFSKQDLKEKHDQAQASFLRQGITFTVYQDYAGTERTMPFDFIPVVMPNDEWEHIEKGMKQRVKALNLFLEDVFSEQRIIKDGIIPRRLIEENENFLGELKGVSVPLKQRIFLAGIDLIRDQEGTYRVLEDNLRNPSGLSYVYQNRFVMRQIFPEFFENYQLYTLQTQLSQMRNALLDYGQQNNSKDPNAVLLTPGVYNSAYYDHVFLAQQMGIDLVEGSDLVVENGFVYMRTIYGLKKVDVIYRRIDDAYLDRTVFKKESLLGVDGLFKAYKEGNVAIVNALGNGVADDKATYIYVPDMILYYLNEEPLIPNVKTYMLENKKEREWVLDNLPKLVIKNVGASGGYDMLIGPHASNEEIERFRKKIIESPNQYIAQPTIQLSRTPVFQDNEFYPCHIDLRVFVINGKSTHVIPGGLSRVALKKVR